MYTGMILNLKNNLLDTFGDQITNYNSGYICDIFSEIADCNVDIYDYDLYDWAKNNYAYIDEATCEYSRPGNIVKEIQQGQYYKYETDLNKNKSDILLLYTYNYLNENDIILTEEQEEEMTDYVSSLNSNDKLEDINFYCDQILEKDNEIDL